jgi:hypothetical protein
MCSSLSFVRAALVESVKRVALSKAAKVSEKTRPNAAPGFR